MSLIRINREPSGRQLALFGLACVVVLGGCAHSLTRHEHRMAAGIVWGLAAALPVLFVVRRRLLRHLYLGLSYATYPIGMVVSHIILAVIYYLVLTPVGLALRLCGHDPLARRFDPKLASYWTARSPTPSSETYFRQS